jgi:hypothetical protein
MMSLQQAVDFVKEDIRQVAAEYPDYYTHLTPSDGSIQASVRQIFWNSGSKGAAEISEKQLSDIVKTYVSIGCTPYRLVKRGQPE